MRKIYIIVLFICFVFISGCADKSIVLDLPFSSSSISFISVYKGDESIGLIDDAEKIERVYNALMNVKLKNTSNSSKDNESYKIVFNLNDGDDYFVNYIPLEVKKGILNFMTYDSNYFTSSDIIGILNTSFNKDVEASFPPMVMIGGKLYKDSGYVSSALRCGNCDGKISSSVPLSKRPSLDNQSNFGKGYGYQIGLGEHRIDVLIDGKFEIFYEIGYNEKSIPDDVAHFSGMIMDVKGGFLKVKVISVPDNFKHIFKRFDLDSDNTIIDVPMDNLIFPDDNDINIESIMGKTVEVWFDGEVYNSKGLELKNAYRISFL